MDTPLLTEDELAAHWNMSLRMLQRWRMEGKGPRFIKLGRCVRYRLADALAFENHVVAGDPRAEGTSVEAPAASPVAEKLTVAQEATLARIRKFLGTEHLATRVAFMVVHSRGADNRLMTVSTRSIPMWESVQNAQANAASLELAFSGVHRPRVATRSLSSLCSARGLLGERWAATKTARLAIPPVRLRMERFYENTDFTGPGSDRPRCHDWA